MSDFLNQRWFRSKKQHRCVWCGELIVVGERYLYRAYRFDGKFQTDHLHEECSVALATHPDQQFMIEEGFEAYSFERGGYDPK